jgi:hypothetical protein
MSRLRTRFSQWKVATAAQYLSDRRRALAVRRELVSKVWVLCVQLVNSAIKLVPLVRPDQDVVLTVELDL